MINVRIVEYPEDEVHLRCVVPVKTKKIECAASAVLVPATANVFQGCVFVYVKEQEWWCLSQKLDQNI